MALDPGAMHNRIIKNLAEKTGHALPHWLKILDKVADDKATRMAHLKTDHGLGHYTAVAIVREKMDDVPWSAPDRLEADLRTSFTPEHVALYDSLRDYLAGLDGVTIVPCKTYTGFTAKRQFAVLKPSKTDGLHVGFALPVDAEPGLEPAKSLGSARISARAAAAVGEERLKALLDKALLLDRL